MLTLPAFRLAFSMNAFCCALRDAMAVLVATLTPLMEAIERDHVGVKVFSLPSVDHPQYGRHIDLGVKGAPNAVEPAYVQLRAGLLAMGLAEKLGPELERR